MQNVKKLVTEKGSINMLPLKVKVVKHKKARY